MLVNVMTRQASIDLLTRTQFGRLAYSHEGQPSISLMYYVYEDNYIYSFSTLGQKIGWMRVNPLVCVETDEVVSPQNWATVVILGKYEELRDTAGCEGFRKRGYDLLQKRPIWWEPGIVKTAVDEKTLPMEFLYFRIHIDQISGRRRAPD